MEDSTAVMLMKDLYPLGPGTTYCESADTVASVMSKIADPYRMAEMRPDLREVVRTPAEWKGSMKPSQEWISKLKGDHPPAPADRNDFLQAVENAVLQRGAARFHWLLVRAVARWSGS